VLSSVTQTRNIAGFAVSFHALPSEIETEWRALEAVGVASVFQSYDWCATWCRTAATPSGETPLIVAGRTTGGQLAFILPLAIRNVWGGGQIGWLAQNCSAHNMGLYDRKSAGRLSASVLMNIMRQIRHLYPNVVLAHFHGQPWAWDGIDNPFVRLGAARSGQSLYVLPTGTSAFETVFRKQVARRHRRKIRKCEAYFCEYGRLQSDNGKTPGEKSEIFEAFVRQKSDQLAGTGHDNIYDRPEIVAFFRALLHESGLGQNFHVSATWGSDELAACAIGVRHHERYYIVMLARTLGDLSSFSPGHVAVKRAIEYQIGQGAQFIDFGAGYSGLKGTWHCQVLRRFDTAFALGAAGLPIAGVLRTRQMIEGAVRANPAFFNIAKRALVSLRRLRARLLGERALLRLPACRHRSIQSMAAKTRSGGV
jgi:CelD/BcsL family acetyltransferase involved in cellulose biosynthesis